MFGIFKRIEEIENSIERLDRKFETHHICPNCLCLTTKCDPVIERTFRKNGDSFVSNNEEKLYFCGKCRPNYDVINVYEESYILLQGVRFANKWSYKYFKKEEPSEVTEKGEKITDSTEK